MSNLDQFYTKKDIAIECYNTLQSLVQLEKYDILLEPSAGTGSFFNLLDVDRRLGIDLDPKCDGVTKMNFLDFKHEDKLSYIAIGNPPFGKISSLAVKFFNKCAMFCDCIAFIIPRTFKRVSIQNQLDLNFKLLYSIDLPLKPCCFTPEMSAKCCFQIWKRSDVPRTVIKFMKSHPDFQFLKHGKKDIYNQPTPPSGADFVIKAYGSNCGEIVENGLNMLRPKSWHWIKSNIDIETLKARFRSLDYSISKDTVRQDSLGQQELIYLYTLFEKK